MKTSENNHSGIVFYFNKGIPKITFSYVYMSHYQLDKAHLSLVIMIKTPEFISCTNLQKDVSVSAHQFLKFNKMNKNKNKAEKFIYAKNCHTTIFERYLLYKI